MGDGTEIADHVSRGEQGECHARAGAALGPQESNKGEAPRCQSHGSRVSLVDISAWRPRTDHDL